MGAARTSDRESRAFARWSEIRLQYNSAFDYSYFCDLTDKIISCVERDKESAFACVGEGSHFSVYKVLTPYPQLQGDRLLWACSIAKPNFLERRGLFAREFMQLMELAQSIKNPLIPPTFTFQSPRHKRLVYFQPYCEMSFKDQPGCLVSEIVRLFTPKLLDSMNERGIEIADILQFRGMGQHPFLIDWSDLKYKNH